MQAVLIWPRLGLSLDTGESFPALQSVRMDTPVRRPAASASPGSLLASSLGCAGQVVGDRGGDLVEAPSGFRGYLVVDVDDPAGARALIIGPPLEALERVGNPRWNPRILMTHKISDCGLANTVAVSPCCGERANSDQGAGVPTAGRRWVGTVRCAVPGGLGLTGLGVGFWTRAGASALSPWVPRPTCSPPSASQECRESND